MSVEYKYKPAKHECRVTNKTIDELHNEYMKSFEKNHSSLSTKRNQLVQLQNQLKSLEKNPNTSNNIPINLDLDLLKKKNNIKKQIKDLNKEINDIENFSGEMEYYCKTGEIIFNYYDITNGILYNTIDESIIMKQNAQKENNFVKSEPNWFDEKINYNNKISSTDNNYSNNADNVNNTINNTVSVNNNMNVTNNNNNNIIKSNSRRIEISDELLQITNQNKKRKVKKPVKRRNRINEVSHTKNIMSLLLGNDMKEQNDANEKTFCKAKLQNEYLAMMDKEYTQHATSNEYYKVCDKCKLDLIIEYNHSLMSCPKCGESDFIFIESDIPSQRDSFTEKPKYPYKRRGHCIEKLNQFLCKGTANIPADVYNAIDEELYKHGLQRKDLTVMFIEKMLKKHKMSMYYEYIMFIYSKLTKTPPITISRQEYDLAIHMFDVADEAYELKFKPKNRNNFLKYTFVLSKIFLTMGREDIADHFKLLKNPLKMKEQEKIWQQICDHVGWKYKTYNKNTIKMY